MCNYHKFLLAQCTTRSKGCEGMFLQDRVLDIAACVIITSFYYFNEQPGLRGLKVCSSRTGCWTLLHV